MKLTVNAVERAPIRRAPVSLDMMLNGRSNIRFGLDAFPLGLPDRYQDIVLYAKDEVTPLFGGVVSSARAKGIEFGAVKYAGDIDGVDYALYADFRLVTMEVTVATPLEDIVEEIVDDYLAPYGITYTPTITGVTVAPFSVESARASDLLRDLCLKSGWVFRVLPSKELVIFELGATSAPFSITDAAPHCREITWATTPKHRANAVSLWAGTGEEETTEYFVTDGVATSWTTAYPSSLDINKAWPNVLYFDGVAQGPVCWFLDGVHQIPAVHWDWNPRTHTLTAPSPPAAGITIAVWYMKTMPFNVTVNSGASPVIEQRVVAPHIKTIEEATDYANSLLDILDQDNKELVVTTLEDGCYPGQELTINLTTRDIVGTFMITSVNLRISYDGDWTYTLTCVDSSVYKGAYPDAWREMLGGTNISIVTNSGGTGNSSPGSAALPLNSVQFNLNSRLGGDAAFLFDPTLKEVQITEEYGKVRMSGLIAGRDTFTDATGASGKPAVIYVESEYNGSTILHYTQMWKHISATHGYALTMQSGGGAAWTGPGPHAYTARTSYQAWAAHQYFFSANPTGRLLPFMDVDGAIAMTGLYGNVDVASFASTSPAIAADSTWAFIFTGTSPKTLPLFDLDATSGSNFDEARILLFKNAGSADLTLQAASGEVIWDGTSSANTFVLSAGRSILLQGCGATSSAAQKGWHIIASHGLGAATAAGSNTQVLFNDGGVIAADSQFTFDKTNGVITITNLDGYGAVKAKNNADDASIISLYPTSLPYGEITFGRELLGGVDTARTATPGYVFWSDQTNKTIGMEINTEETPDAAMAYAKGAGFQMHKGASTPWAFYLYDYGALGTGNVPGMGLRIERNAQGNGAAAYISLQQQGGSPIYLWAHAGAIRSHTAPPTEDNSTVAHTAGSVIGAGSGSTNAFGTVEVAGQSDVVAAAAPDTMEFIAGSGMTITTNAGAKQITFASTGGSTPTSETLDVDCTDVSVGNSGSEGTLYSVAVPGNTLGANGLLRVTLSGSYLNNSGAARGFTIKIKFGGVTLYEDLTSSTAFAASSTLRQWSLRAYLGNANATNVQRMNFIFSMSGLSTAITGSGDIAGSPFIAERAMVGIDGSSDTTSAQTFEVTITHTTAHASLTMTRHISLAEVLKA